MTGRVAFYLLNTLVIVLSLLTAFGAAPVPDIVGISIAFYVLLLLPGVLIGRLCFGSIEISLRGIGIVFFSGLVFVSLLVCLAFLPGVSFPALSLTAAGVDILLLSLQLKRGRIEPAGASHMPGSPKRATEEGGHRSCLRVSIALLLFALLFVFYYGSAETNWSTDAPDHLSFIRRAVDSGKIFPHDSYHKGGDGTVFDPRKGLWHPVLSLWLYHSDANPAYFWSMLPSFLAFFAMVSFLLFASALLGSASYVAFAFVLLILFYREDGIGWFAKLGYSRNISQMILWIDFSFLLSYYRRGDGRLLAFACALTLVGISFHLAFFLLIVAMLLGLLLYIHLTKRGMEWRKRFWLSMPILAVSALVPLFVRAVFTFSAYNHIHTHLQGILLLPWHLMVPDPIEILTHHGLMFFFALPLAIYVLFSRGDRERSLLIGTLFIVPVLVVLVPPVSTILEKRLGYMLVRLLYAAPTMCLSALALGRLLGIVIGRGAIGAEDERARAGRRSAINGPESFTPHHPDGNGYRYRDRRPAVWAGIAKRFAALVVLMLFILYPGRLATRALFIRTGNIWHGAANMKTEYLEIAEILESRLPDHSVVLSDPMMSYIISAYTDHFVTVTLDQHCSPSDIAVVTRHKAVRDILSPAVSVSESVRWLELLGARYILINSDPDTEAAFYRTVRHRELPLTLEKLRSCGHLFKEIYRDDMFSLFEIEVDSPQSASSAACDVSLAAPLPCRVDSTGIEIEYPCGVTLARMELNSNALRPGDTLSGSFCWRTARDQPFESPIRWSVRMDTDYPKGAFFRPWYSKQYRRRIERRNGIRYRFTRFERLMSGCIFPDQWENCREYRQDFAFVLPDDMAKGRYEIRLSVRKIPFLRNSTISDYLMNNDSLQGETIGVLWIDNQAPEHAEVLPLGPDG